jgi:hypothetical protein
LRFPSIKVEPDKLLVDVGESTRLADWRISHKTRGIVPLESKINRTG